MVGGPPPADERARSQGMSEEDTDCDVSLPRQVTSLLPPKENFTSQRKMDLGRKQLTQAGRSLGAAAQARRPDVTQQHVHRCFYVGLQLLPGRLWSARHRVRLGTFCPVTLPAPLTRPAREVACVPRCPPPPVHAGSQAAKSARRSVVACLVAESCTARPGWEPRVLGGGPPCKRCSTSNPWNLWM